MTSGTSRRAMRLLAGAASMALLAFSAEAAELALKRVMLSAGGVGYFEYQAEVSGWEQLSIPVRLDQVDDVLKSAVVFDDAGGSGTIELQGRDSLNEIFRTMPIGPDAFNSPAELYAALKGEEITISDPVSARGKIVSVVEETAEKENASITRHRMAIMTDSGLVQFVLEEGRDIAFTNEALNAKVNDALSAIATNRQRELRTLKITARGEGARTVTVGFVIEAPLWKTSYRLVTGADGKARMQGWAVIENASGADWTDVELTLVSGNPVTFKQALYDKYYVQRESVPVEVLGRVSPRRDDGSTGGEDSDWEQNGQGSPIEPAPEPMSVPSPAAPPPAKAAMPQTEEVSVTGSRISTEPGQVAAESAESATSVIFTLSNAVTAGSGQSLAVPILDREVPAQLISFYQPYTHPTHPLSAVKLTNDTGTGLPPGITTLFDSSGGRTVFSGDAVLSVLPVGENRILSFALDQKVVVDASDARDDVITGAKLAGGVLEIQMVQRKTNAYSIKGAANEDRNVVIETPRYNWELKSHDLAKTDATYNYLRIPVFVAAGKTEKLDVVWENVTSNTISAVDQLYASDYAYYASTESRLPEPIRAAFVRMAELRVAVDAADRAINALDEEQARIYDEQERIRSNLAAVPEGSDMQRRYLASLATQEDRLAAIAAERGTRQAELSAARQALTDYVMSLTL
ncbi:MAG: hypothetical protein QM698_01115 [Micropepsaceae bacterium]